LKPERLSKTSILVALCLGGSLALSFLISPTWESGFTVCYWKSTTGLPCLACGLTHAFVYVSHGQFTRAMEANPLVLVLYPAFWFGLLWSVGCATGRVKGPDRPSAWILWLLLGTVILGSVSRMVAQGVNS